jgi:tetratricopeptide (TPR) repeat protein
MLIGRKILLLTLLAPVAASAQMSVSTFGATDARLCYEAALDNFEKSADVCDKALKTAGLTIRDRTATFVNRGIVLNRAGRLDEALADFNKALESNDELAEAFLNRGNTFYLMRRYDEAIADYEASLTHDLQKSHVAWYNIGLAHEAKRDDVKARSAYQTALEINPDFGPAQKKLGVSGQVSEGE